MQFATGGRVGARGLTWDVVEAAPSGAQQRLRLRCAAGDLRGLEWDLLHPLEPVEGSQAALRPDAPGSLAAWRLHHMACLLEQVPGPEAILAAEPGRVTVEPYQLVPLMRALEMPRPRLLLADGVGLGKTIQAGLIATELIARRRAHRILVVAPAGPLLAQWAYELRHRFGLRFTPITDAASLQRERRRIEFGVNPFDSIALCLIALDFAKQERVLEELERSSWDIAIIDEAHHCAATGIGTDDTLRRRLAETIARRSDGLLLLTATPHDGYDAHFASLIELLDPSLVDGRGGLVGSAYRRHVIRRLKTHIRDAATGVPLFRPRRVLPVRIEQRSEVARPVQAFHAALAALVAPRLRRAGRSGDAADALAFIGLLKRSVSTIAACVGTLSVVAERYGALRAGASDDEALHKERARVLRTYRRRLLRFGVLADAEEAGAAALEAEDMAADLCRFGAPGLPADSIAVAEPPPDGSAAVAGPPNGDDTAEALRRLIRLGKAAERHDPKLQAMLDEVRLIRTAHPGANILIYTEYADSQAAGLDALRRAHGIGGEILAIGGDDPEAERIRVAERCAEHDGIVLVSTDSMAEGLNLHQRCCHLIHLDLPYNPNRLEQRNGRIDRYGQRRDPEIRYLYLAGTFEERLLLRLIAKYEKARACLDVMPNTLGVTADESVLAKGLASGFADDQAALFPEDAPAIRTLDRAAEEQGNTAAYRDLMREIDRAFNGYDRHAVRHGWLAEQGLNSDLRQVGAADAVRQRSDAALGHVDLVDFVAAAIEAETGCPAREVEGLPNEEHLPLPLWEGGGGRRRLRRRSGFDSSPQPSPGRGGGDVLSPAPDAVLLRIPLEWKAGLDGLPGYDAAASMLRITRDRPRLRDAQGGSLAFPGRAHPLVRRAIARAHSGDMIAGSALDYRVSAARAPDDELALLLTFGVEIGSGRRDERRSVVAVLLREAGPPIELTEPEQWLRLATPENAVPAVGLWRGVVAPRMARSLPQAEKLAASCMRRAAAAFGASQRDLAEREVIALENWLTLRADDICGGYVPRTADLFGTGSEGPAWKSLASPLDRLAAYVADPDNPPARRREANGAVALFRQRTDEAKARTAVPTVHLRPLGMLMLVPDRFIAAPLCRPR